MCWVCVGGGGELLKISIRGQKMMTVIETVIAHHHSVCVRRAISNMW